MSYSSASAHVADAKGQIHENTLELIKDEKELLNALPYNANLSNLHVSRVDTLKDPGRREAY